jgi:hypothetical protein
VGADVEDAIVAFFVWNAEWAIGFGVVQSNQSTVFRRLLWAADGQLSGRGIFSLGSLHRKANSSRLLVSSVAILWTSDDLPAKAYLFYRRYCLVVALDKR